MKYRLFILLSLLMMLGCEDEKTVEDLGLQGEVIVDGYFTYGGAINIKYRIYNSGSEDISDWKVYFTVIVNSGLQYFVIDTTEWYNSYLIEPGDTSNTHTALRNTSDQGIYSVSLDSVIFIMFDDSTLLKQKLIFADDHWSLTSWVESTQLNLVQYSDFKIDGAHELILQLSGSLANEFGYFVSSDSLVNHPEWIYNDDVSVARDDSFYFYIGLYNQFVGGWDDISQWYIIEKTVEDTIETILMTPNKKLYLDM